ncbi:hypothetical protein BRYFOR_09602 [Marvinbryantia formatexigens DSM 14469]|uniref:Uncharacterized protein n=1 Tax=Marvinbryantia formatexigens DSM 14469 TaxID=478749 RepID=C6LLQ4_9FIRM|nr:hypothetical protein BRYFOR_09602 [Marvinbryantia formatexigens DSM 14469]
MGKTACCSDKLTITYPAAGRKRQLLSFFILFFFAMHTTKTSDGRFLIMLRIAEL